VGESLPHHGHGASGFVAFVGRGNHGDGAPTIGHGNAVAVGHTPQEVAQSILQLADADGRHM
jgi:hypothetical protein